MASTFLRVLCETSKISRSFAHQNLQNNVCARTGHQFLRRQFTTASSSNPIQVIKTLDEFNASLSKAGGLTVAYFTAAWCGPCKMIWPHVLELAKQNPPVTFLKIDVDEAQEVAASNEISAMPTFVLIKGGRRVDSLVGANPNALKDLVAKHTKPA